MAKYIDEFTKDMFNIIRDVRLYADTEHKRVNHNYDENDYVFHLDMVRSHMLNIIECVNELEGFDSNFMFVLLCASYTHDLIEDCRVTYNDLVNDLQKKYGGLSEQQAIQVAELTYAVTNEKGKTRSERANKKYYDEMREVPGAVLLKIADRTANLQYSKETDSSMYLKYVKELPDFINSITKTNCTDDILLAIKYMNEHR